VTVAVGMGETVGVRVKVGGTDVAVGEGVISVYVEVGRCVREGVGWMVVGKAVGETTGRVGRAGLHEIRNKMNTIVRNRRISLIIAGTR